MTNIKIITRSIAIASVIAAMLFGGVAQASAFAAQAESTDFWPTDGDKPPKDAKGPSGSR